MTERLKGIAGSMFSGKTETLIQDIERSFYRKQNTLVFKPALDTRWDKQSFLRSHSGKEIPAIPISEPYEILEEIKQFLRDNRQLDLVAIDEIQFFDASIIPVIQQILEADIKVVFAGLSTDFRGEPFGSMPTLLSLSDEIIKVTAVCVVCGHEATRTQRLINGQPANYDDPIVLIGAEQEYQARCPNHHLVPGKPKPSVRGS